MKSKLKTKGSKKNIVSVLQDLDAAAVKPCNVRLMKLQESKGHYKASDIVKPTVLSKKEKTLLIPKKGRKEAVKAAPKKFANGITLILCLLTLLCPYTFTSSGSAYFLQFKALIQPHGEH